MTLQPAWAVAAGWGLSALFFGLVWLLQHRRGNAGIVDVAWAAGIGLLAIFYAAVVPGDAARRALTAALCAAWAFRLAAYLFHRNVGKPEDGRYRSLREKWGAAAPRRMFWFFQVQAVTVVILALCPLAAMLNPRPLSGVWTFAAVAVLIASILGEAAADAQLARFKARPDSRGRTCREGLWRTSRHPNYFFEWLHWWTYVLLAAGSGWVFVALVGPVSMWYVLVKLTGIAVTEAHALETRADYRDYQKTTSAFVPWFSRKG